MDRLLAQIASKLSELQSLRPIKPEYLNNIRQKFRLEYNYHSNHLEGNSLTMAETWSFLSTALVSSEKIRKFADYREMKGHDDAVSQYNLLDNLEYTTTELQKQDFQISHKLIKEINHLLLVEDHKKSVQDQNSERYFVDVIVGQYKDKNNHVLRKDGSMFHFAPIEQTQHLMTDLIDWYNNSKDHLHPIILASIFHYKFIRIHPFDDGNGRTARFLTNMILMHYGYPIIIVPSDNINKQNYYNTIQLVDSAYSDLSDCINDKDTILFEPFIRYSGERLLRSFDQVIDGAQGKSIFDPGDIIKKFKLELASKNSELEQTPDHSRLQEGDNFLNVLKYYVVDFVDTTNMFVESLVDQYQTIQYKVDISPEVIHETWLQGSIPDGLFRHKFVELAGYEQLKKEITSINITYTLSGNKLTKQGNIIKIQFMFENKKLQIHYQVLHMGYQSSKRYGEFVPIIEKEQLLSDMIKQYQDMINKLT